jgi:hypothetical protein
MSSISLMPDRLLAEGRYRLLVSHGADPSSGLEFWRAHDQLLERDVALTVLLGKQSDSDSVQRAERILRQARLADAMAEQGVARVLDMCGPAEPAPCAGVIGLVVAAWTSATPEADGDNLLPDSARSPGDAARMLRPLAAAVDRAHHAGLVLGVADRRRVRLDEQGVLTLAFPGPGVDATAREDVRGLGELLYGLLTGAWPPADSRRITPPDLLRPGVSRELSMVTVLSIDESSVAAIRTGGPLLHALDTVIQDDPRTEPVPLVSAPPPPPLLPDPEPAAMPDPGAKSTPKPTPTPRRAAVTVLEPVTREHRFHLPQKGRRRVLAVGALAVAMIAIGVSAAAQITGFANHPAAPRAVAAALPPANSSAPATTTAPPAAPQLVAVVPSGVTEYMQSGSPDNPSKISRVISGDTTSGWSTDQYNQQFPSLVPGIGIMAAFDTPQRISTVSVASPSAGTVVQVKAAAGPETPLDSTQLLATATLNAGMTTIPLPNAAPTQYLLVWITQLADSGGGYKSTINQITYQALAQPDPGAPG